MSSEKNRFRSRIALVFLFALAIRILCAWPALWSYFMGDVDMESFMRPDSATYYFPARAFVETGKLTLDVGSDFPAVQRPPGYIFFLVAVIFLSCPPVIGCLVDALTVFPVALAGRRLAGRRAGFWAAVLYALNLTALANAPLILADTLLGFLCAWQVFFFVRAWRTKRLSDILFGTVFAAAATLTKPVNLPVLLLIPFVLTPLLMR
ncbi:MAG: glycosyltransferase family 39 protein, partial [Lentisphaeria bacterium]|nr:glycosyltransferase family 39 protein [Lentisphaeria bacterium]